MKLLRQLLAAGWHLRQALGRRLRRVAADRQDAPKTLFAEMRACAWVLLAMEIWPLYDDEKGRVVFRKRSLRFTYALLAWICTTFISCRAILHWIRVIQSASYFSLQAYYAFFVVVGHMSIGIPLLYWTHMRGIAEAFNYTHRFQANFRRVRGAPLHFGVAGKSGVVGVLSPIAGVAFTVWSHDAGYVPWDQFPVYELNATYLTILPETWQVVAGAVEQAALQLHAQMVQVLHDGGGEGVGSRCRALGQVRWLWVQLQHSVRLWSSAWTPCLAHLIFSSLAVVLLSVFGITIPLLRGQMIDDRLAGMMVGAIHNSYNIHRMCAVGDTMRQKVKDDFVKELLRTKLCDEETDMYTEVVKFLKEVELQDPSISMGGYATLNKALAVACAALLLTYVVILLQFAYAKGAQ